MITVLDRSGPEAVSWPEYSEGVIRRHFRSQIAQTGDFSGFWWPNFTENGVWGHLTGVAETRANTEMHFYNLS
jgi:hypothetical protein